MRFLRCLILLVACASEPPDSPTAEPADAAQTTAGPQSDGSEDEIDALIALGYLDYVEGGTNLPSGVSTLDRSQTQPGLTLLVSRVHREADLVNLDGQVVHRWNSGDAEGRWVRARLLPGGDLLVVGKGEEGPVEGRYLQRLAWDGAEIWRRSLAVHHEISPGPDGGWLTLEMRYVDAPEVHASTPVRDDLISFLSPDGQRLRSLSLLDSLLASGMEWVDVEETQGDSGSMVDLFHSNSLVWLDTVTQQHPEWSSLSEAYAPGGVMICIRHQNLIAILDSMTGQIRWSWGPGELSGPHDATLLDTGNVLIFDNGLGSNRSRLVEVDPRTNEMVWEYQAPVPTDFYTASRGSAQRLPNGNTLVSESEQGHVFELNPKGDVVWDYRTFHRSPEGQPATLIRAIRYPESWVPLDAEALHPEPTASQPESRSSPVPAGGKSGVFDPLTGLELSLWNSQGAGDQIQLRIGDIRFEMSYAPAGSFVVGSPDTEVGRDPDEGHQPMTLKRGYYVATTEVSQELYRAVMGVNPSSHTGCDACPVEQVSWFDALKFCNRLSEIWDLQPVYILTSSSVSSSETANGYRLPSEEEWEYAARAGQTHVYSGSDDVDSVAWYYGNSEYQTHPVGTKKPNAWGLYDMTGNVFEWTDDWVGSRGAVAESDRPDAEKATYAAVRGGRYGSPADRARVANLSSSRLRRTNASMGFRVILPEPL